jgi:hypothetical protein
MKRIALSTLVFCVAACTKKDSAVPGRFSDTKKEERALEERMRSVEGFLAKHGEPEPAEVISPALTQRALREFSLRVGNAKKIEAKIRFVERVMAIVTVSYTLGSSDARREQEIQFIHGNREWAMFWIPVSQKKQANRHRRQTGDSPGFWQDQRSSML